MPTSRLVRVLVGSALTLAVLSSAIGCSTGAAGNPQLASDHQGTSTSASATPTPTPTPEVTTSRVSETSAIPFAATTRDDPARPAGQTAVVTAGANGVLTTTYEVTTVDGRETSRTQVSQSVTTPPIDQVTAIGSYVAPPPPPAPVTSNTGTVVPGGFCSPSQQGVTATASNGRSYTCGGKGADASGHLHWNTIG